MPSEKHNSPIVKVDGFIEKGKQFDVEILLPEDNRNVIYGVIKDCYNEPVEDAVVKLIEVKHEYGKKERAPVSHTFTNKAGEFVFGPLCPDKIYEILFWADRVKHIKICKQAQHQGNCLKGIHLDCDDDFHDCKKCDCKKDDDDEKDFDKKKSDKKDGYKKDDEKDDYKYDYKKHVR